MSLHGSGCGLVSIFEWSFFLQPGSVLLIEVEKFGQSVNALFVEEIYKQSFGCIRPSCRSVQESLE